VIDSLHHRRMAYKHRGDVDHRDEQIKEMEIPSVLLWAIPSHICVDAVLAMFYFHMLRCFCLHASDRQVEQSLRNV